MLRKAKRRKGHENQNELEGRWIFVKPQRTAEQHDERCRAEGPVEREGRWAVIKPQRKTGQLRCEDRQATRGAEREDQPQGWPLRRDRVVIYIEAAKLLGLHPNNLHRLMKNLNLK